MTAEADELQVVSFFSDRYGLVCDTVRRFEIVLTSGRIVNTTASSYRDLWLALKGGSNNFGVVTAIEQDVFEQGDFWVGIVFTDARTFAAQFLAFESFTANPGPDPYAALITSFSFVPQIEQWVGPRNTEYTKSEPYPAAFANFTALPTVESSLQVSSTMRISHLSDFTHEIAVTGNPPGVRDIFLMGTYRNSAAMIGAIFQAANDTLQEIKQTGFVAFTIGFQPITKSLLQASAAAGGNSLGLNASDVPSFNFLLTVSWQSSTNDALIDSKARELYQRVEATAQQLSVRNPYIHLNYAAPWQDPIISYGQEVKKQLQNVSRKYDPRGVFQRLVSGGFKLFD